MHEIDPDGFAYGERPVQVRCEVEKHDYEYSNRERKIGDTTDGRMATVIEHTGDSINGTWVKPCNEKNCHTEHYDYNMPMTQIRALIEVSERCEQRIRARACMAEHY